MVQVRPLATAEQVSEFLGVPVATLYQWRHRGVGPRGAKVGRHLRFRWADVEKWFEDQTSGGSRVA
ncbi:helix-turn-helix domain-containing protein [Micromonospora aurantiaca (nom. illeg.)]|uniref:helix-turn-helix domain-containing protein n=1 Tax=Micromonospora aurantiaca (nom. illeg.) TaxID=47850 RepID=UPI0033FBA775